MTEQRTTTSPTTAPRWAPWWVYVVVILGANALRQALMPVGTIPEWAVVVATVGLSAVLFVFVTAAFRTRVRPGRPPGGRPRRTPS